MTPSGTILLFNINAPEKQTAIRLTALRLGLRCVEVSPAQQNRTLEALLTGQDTTSAPEGLPFPDEMLVLSGLSSEAFHTLLDTLRREGQTVRLKAVVTAHNRSWSAVRLHRELLAEAEALEKRKQSLHASPHKKRNPSKG